MKSTIISFINTLSHHTWKDQDRNSPSSLAHTSQLRKSFLFLRRINATNKCWEREEELRATYALIVHLSPSLSGSPRLGFSRDFLENHKDLCWIWRKRTTKTKRRSVTQQRRQQQIRKRLSFLLFSDALFCYLQLFPFFPSTLLESFFDTLKIKKGVLTFLVQYVYIHNNTAKIIRVFRFSRA